MSVMDRRSFFKVVATTGAAAAAGGCSPSAGTLLPYVVPPDNIVPGVPAYFSTVCRECPAGCGLVAKNRDGRVVKLEGHPESFQLEQVGSRRLFVNVPDADQIAVVDRNTMKVIATWPVVSARLRNCANR